MAGLISYPDHWNFLHISGKAVSLPDGTAGRAGRAGHPCWPPVLATRIGQVQLYTAAWQGVGPSGSPVRVRGLVRQCREQG